MDRFPPARRRRLRACLTGSLAVFLCCGATPFARADQLEQHNDLVAKLIAEQQANPLAADCAAHADFVVPTSPLYDRIEFADGALDDAHATIEPWDGAFDSGKQRTRVDTMVTIEGTGYRKTGSQDKLTIRCGYLQNQMLAFDYNEPKMPAAAKKKGRPTKHGVSGKGKGKAKTKIKSTSGKSRGVHKASLRKKH